MLIPYYIGPSTKFVLSSKLAKCVEDKYGVDMCLISHLNYGAMSHHTDYHCPVLLEESLEALALKPTGCYIDATFGGGGHSRAIVAQLRAEGRLIGVDQDPEAIKQSKRFPSTHFKFLTGNFRFLQQLLQALDIRQVDGILADLGTSSHQIDTPTRGFSTRFDGPLDMRMTPNLPATAYDLVQRSSVTELTQWLQCYGEVPRAKALATAIVATRANEPLSTTQELMTLLQRFSPKYRLAQYSAQVFQALRIAVNDELNALQQLLQQAAELLVPSGRLVVIAYHSLEDRLVKRFLRAGNFTGQQEKDTYGNVLRPFAPLYNKPITARAAELAYNPRARSAKLRVGVRG